MTAFDPSALPLIAGAGPVGLAAGLLLAQGGVRTRLVERKDRRVPLSKALAVNPRTLEILEPTGVTARMLAMGRPIRGARFWRRGRVLAQSSLAALPHKYPFMLALSQGTTERLLEDAFLAAGGEIEWGVELTGCRAAPDHVEVELRRHAPPAATAAGERRPDRERYACPWLLAADGAHSAARAALDIAFPGTSFDREWHLCDVPLDTDLPGDSTHAFMLDGGRVMVYIPVVDDAANPPPGAPVWRVFANLPRPLERLQMARPAGPATWESTFRIEHRIAARLQAGMAFLAGDAAHVHSPLGARGMNLGIEDAWTFSQLVFAGQMQRYGAIRRKVDGRVVRQVEQLTRLARGESIGSRFLRRWMLPNAAKIPSVRNRAMAAITGLDHPLTAI